MLKTSPGNPRKCRKQNSRIKSTKLSKISYGCLSNFLFGCKLENYFSLYFHQAYLVSTPQWLPFQWKTAKWPTKQQRAKPEKCALPLLPLPLPLHLCTLACMVLPLPCLPQTPPPKLAKPTGGKRGGKRPNRGREMGAKSPKINPIRRDFGI